MAKEPEIAPWPQRGAESTCRDCGQVIIFTGQHWAHTASSPRHMAIPFARRRPTSPAPPSEGAVIASAAVRAMAEKIAADLMTNPGGAADRLVLTRQDGRDMGGWARGPLTDRIEMLLRGER